MASATTKNLTILLTDVKGFTEKTAHKSRADILEMLERHKKLVLPLLESRGGALVKTIGDAYLMSFESPTDAVLAGVAVQDALRAYNEDKSPDERVEIRVAINSGEVTLADNDVFGDPVNITARIEGVAEAGEVFFTEAVYLAMNKTEVPSSEIGLLQLKGIPEKIRVYKVKREVPPGSAAAGIVTSALRASSKASVVSGTPAARRPAALGRRAAALAIDWIVCLMIAGAFTHDQRDNASRAGLVFAGIWFLYQLVSLKRWGSTLGGRICRLTVVRIDGAPLERRDRRIRAAASVLSGYACMLGYLWALWDKDGRGWHDLLADTRVTDAA